MTQRDYDAAQQGLLTCLLDDDHESRLIAFLDGLRRSQEWPEDRVREVENKIREMLANMRPQKPARIPDFNDDDLSHPSG